mmetsp:Transcript_23204/g.34049  ORF Transcript_23204/g.34049 Transcript_23204/m.34049 type:complete len:1138 (+) Transcript_23204:131-3544(+)|eukprot:CAMPEP_0185035960 /NCGR_PEP_ID=MMETSP1103-20130426/28199_1 /TAXON_ID=36769 /ORGANISM="Paraphysomonas bandaiensis, Strain Caron Lab Isolate" /LENGTH=1137 /DNA_ID=CAMNT_0027573285 /DNA_START=44 /DNA_END=3457 /DNA_ORIENTATION=-
MNRQNARRCKRLEKLMSTGLLIGYAQRVKACFEYLDVENDGYFTLKDLTERGKRVSTDLGLNLDHSSSFSVMDAFRSFDATGKGRVKLEEFATALVVRFQKNDMSFFEDLANDVISSGLSSASDLLASISNPQLEGAFTMNDIDSSYTSSASVPTPPEKFHQAMRAVYYLLQQRLKRKSNINISDFPSLVLAKILKDTYVDASRELKLQLHLSLVRIKAALRDAGGANIVPEGLEEDYDDDDGDSTPMKKGSNSRRGSASLVWKQPKRPDCAATRRMSFEMTQASSLKAQARRSSSILATNQESRRGEGRFSREGLRGDGIAQFSGSRSPFQDSYRVPPGLSMGFGSPDMKHMQSYNVDELIDSSLDRRQLALLHSALKAIDFFFVVANGGTCEDIGEDFGLYRSRSDSFSQMSRGMRAMSMIGGGPMGLRRDSFDVLNPTQRLSYTGSMGYRASLLMNEMQHIGDAIDESARGASVAARASSGAESTATVEAELSQELMETQDKLRRTLMRLEVLELIQMQVQSMEDDMVSPVAGENDPTKNYDNDGDPGAVTASKVPDVVIPEVATFEDIMGTAQELRVLVSSRGMDNMLVGSLLTTPSALLPLQDADLSSKPDSEGQKKKGVENDNPNSPECFVSPSTRIRKPAKKGKVTISVDEPSSPKKKMMQVSAVIAAMEATTQSLSDQLSKKGEDMRELGKWKLNKLVNDERLAEVAVMAEQEHREKEGAAAVAVEVQVLRDRIHTVSYVEDEVKKMKTKNMELGRRIKQLERELLEAQEERDFGKVEVGFGTSGLTVSEEQVMKLKDEIADLRTANARVLKEQQHRGIAAKHAEQRLKMCLQDNLALHQKLNRVEEELNSSKTEVSDLMGQIEHQRDIEEERLQVARKLHSTEMLVTELRSNLLEARAEAAQAAKLREELNVCESRVAKLISAASEAEVEGEGRLTAKQEVDELRAALQQKTRENRDLTISVRSLERKVGEVKALQARLDACQDEVNRYKVRVEQSAPMLAEVARLRGASRAAVRSLQEQDKVIATLEENNKQLRAVVAELTEKTSHYQNMEVKLLESETECQRLSDIVSNDIPLLKEKLKAVQEERRQLEIQCRQIKKTSRQASVASSGPSSGPNVQSKILVDSLKK